jgi:hypothetical protein
MMGRTVVGECECAREREWERADPSTGPVGVHNGRSAATEADGEVERALGERPRDAPLDVASAGTYIS